MAALRARSPSIVALSRLSNLLRTMSASTQLSLSSPIKLGDVELRNRNVMASLTRNRSVPETIPNDANREYYVQRARSAGLVMTEGTLTSPQG